LRLAGQNRVPVPPAMMIAWSIIEIHFSATIVSIYSGYRPEQH
jgi:hypothetical protein